VSKLFLDAGIIVLSAFISPFHADREQVKKIVGSNNFVEVFVNAPIEVCEQRDVKGLYKKARSGEVKNFTGIDSPYEIPKNPDVVIHTHQNTVEQSMGILLDVVTPKIAIKG
jgi:adenylyl-sulfate kinase